MLWVIAFMIVWLTGVIFLSGWPSAFYEACCTGKHFSWNQE